MQKDISFYLDDSVVSLYLDDSVVSNKLQLPMTVYICYLDLNCNDGNHKIF